MDRFVLIHGLGEEAREVALAKEAGKTSDVDKGIYRCNIRYIKIIINIGKLNQSKSYLICYYQIKGQYRTG